MGKRANNEGTVFQRSSDGSWVTRIRGLDGKLIVRYSRTQKEAVAKLKELQRHVSENVVPTAPRRLTVGDWFDTWLQDYVEGKREPKTLRNYRMNVDRHIKPGLGQIRLHGLTAPQVQRFINGKIAEGTLSSRSIAQIFEVLRNGLNKAVKLKLISYNPALGVELPEVKLRKAPVIAIEQAKAILAAVQGHRLEAVFSVAMALGLRSGELRGLRWADVDLAAGIIHVRQQVQRVDQQYVFSDPKSDAGQRTLRMPARLVEALRSHRTRQLEERVQHADRWQDHDLVFTTPYGAPIHESTLLHTLQRQLIAAGLPRLTVHDLRHAAASLMRAQGVSLKEIQVILGHSQFRLTADLYTHVAPELLDDVAAKMDVLFKP